MRSLFFILFIFLNSCKTPGSLSSSTELYFLPVLHQLHKINNNYTYDSLKVVIAKINPDLILTEIRQEDMGRDSVYISSNYPFEMYMVKEWFPQAIIEGFDWLGDDLEGRPVPPGYWKDSSWVKKLQREMQKDSVFLKKAASCYDNSKKRDSILRYSTLRQIVSGEDKMIVIQQYECFERVSQGTPYNRLSKFYRQRNDSILANIKRSVVNYRGRRIVVITGDDHYQLLRDEIDHRPIY